MSTIQCASVVTETINYYVHNKGDIYIYIYIYIYVCTIDTSKALDRVNLFVVFTLLKTVIFAICT